MPDVEARFPTALMGRSDVELMRLALRAHLHQPAVALWRATEFRMLRDVQFAAPVLDLGCGTGAVAGVTLRAHWPLDGLELVAPEARVAQAAGVYRQVLRADAGRAPVASGAYATVYSHSVLEHIPDDQAALREAARVLPPGGRLVFTVPAPAFADRLRAGAGGDARLTQINTRLGHHHYRSVESWRTVLDDLGLSLIGSDGHLPAATQRTWLRLDELLGRRVRGRRVLDWIRGAQRRGRLPVEPWIAVWTAVLWRPFRRRVDEPGGLLIEAERR